MTRKGLAKLQKKNKQPQLTREDSFTSLNDDEHELLSNQLRGVVQVFLNEVEPNFMQPWTKSMPESGTGSGFVINIQHRLIVTNAHCAEFARTILVRKNGDHEKFRAKLLAISHQVDIAILTVGDDEFWKGADTLSFGDMCRMQQTVDVVGYPIGGDTVSCTRGVVSRIDFVPYAQSGGESQLCIQVDAAINPGNSGGPALSNGKLVGIAFQGLNSEEASNVGYIIPVKVLTSLLSEFQHQVRAMGLKLDSNVTNWPDPPTVGLPLVTLRKFARFAPTTQTAENEYLRQSMGMKRGTSGVLIRAVPPVSNLCNLLQKNDVLMAIDNIPIGNEGRVIVPPLQPMDFEYLISMKLVGEPIHYTILREGKKMEINTEAENPERRIPLIDKKPYVPYLMFAGMVLSPLARDSTFTDEPFEDFVIKKEAEFLLAYKGIQYTKLGQQCVVLTSFLPHAITLGYTINPFTPIYKINDKIINSIYDAMEAIVTASEEGLLTFEFCTDQCVVIPMKEGVMATVEVQQDYGMAKPYSQDIEDYLKQQNLVFKLPEVEIAVNNDGDNVNSTDTNDNDENGNDEEYCLEDLDEEELQQLEQAFEQALDKQDDGGRQK